MRICSNEGDIHFWWHLASTAARATLIDVGSKRLGIFLIEVFCAVAAWHAYRAPEGNRWAAIRNQWMSEIRAVFIVIFSVGIGVFGYELSRLRQVEGSLSNPSALFHRVPTIFPLGATNVFPSDGRHPICVQILLPQGFQGGSYKLP